MPDHGEHWKHKSCWRVLDTDFSDGLAFFSMWHQWSVDADRPRVLNYVGLGHTLVAPADLIAQYAHQPELLPLVQELAAQWFGLVPGFHRFMLAQGQVILTLCLGETVELLRQQQFQADAVVLSSQPNMGLGDFEPWTSWSVKALARCCRRGTTLQFKTAALPDSENFFAQLRQSGFDCANAKYDPPWPLKNTRQTDLRAALSIQRCAVIGAGLAGASVAAALARRGWQVHVLDQGEQPATGASGLPVGLIAPHVSSDDCVLSKLSRSGVRLMLQTARQYLIEGLHWGADGVLERQIGGTPQLPVHWSDRGREWSRPALEVSVQKSGCGGGLWHPAGAWIKPAEWVHAALGQAGVTFHRRAHVCSMHHKDGVWHLLDSVGNALGIAERVVLANACGAQELLRALARQQPRWVKPLEHLPSTHGMRGLLSWAQHTHTGESAPSFPDFPVNGFGSLISQIPISGGMGWFTGSSYQPENRAERSDQDNHVINYEHLQQLLPTLANELRPTFASDALQAWKGVRCVSSDRMPLVGALDSGVDPSLWICAGLGSRGLSFSILCAELLAARMGAEPLPIEAHLAKALDALRN